MSNNTTTPTKQPPITWKWFKLWLDAIWFGLRIRTNPRDYAPIACFWCRAWFARDFSWNPWEPRKGAGLCCSSSCFKLTASSLLAQGVHLPAVDEKIEKIKERLERGEYPLDVECLECDQPATISDEPPPCSATANDWWCDFHTPTTPPIGWTRVDLRRWAKHAGPRFMRLVRGDPRDPRK